MATTLFHNIIFGPVNSRRLGVSLGVNLLPDQGKLCNFDCLYCECGWNADNRTDHRLPSREEVQAALEQRLQAMRRQGRLPDAITFSGNGEPTLHPQFAGIIDDTLALRLRYAPHSQICVLSNATTLGHAPVFQALQKTDRPILKIDAVDNSLARLINQPQMPYSVPDIVAHMQGLHGQFALQTLFLRGTCHGQPFDNSSPEALHPWLQTVQLLQPREIMIYTINRDTPSQTLHKLTEDELRAIAQEVNTLNTWHAKIQIAS
jgi:wyosine [tRNA(Phe)-imidazoG37] synthetase (radical SAM superfamily)